MEFQERWYYYFFCGILVWICQRHLSEVIVLSVMSLTLHGRQSRRDYIFGYSIITIWELLTSILSLNRKECFQTHPLSQLWIFLKNGMRHKWNQTIHLAHTDTSFKNTLVNRHEIHVGMSKFLSARFILTSFLLDSF